MPFCCRSSFLFLRCVGLRLASVRSLLPRNFGRQSWRHARLGDDRGFCVSVSSTIILRGSKHLQQLGGFFCETKRLVLHSHPLLVLNSRWGHAVISTYTWTCLFSSRPSLGGLMVWDSAMALASLGFCVIVPTVPSGFVDSRFRIHLVYFRASVVCFLRAGLTVVLHSHPLLVLSFRLGRAMISTYTFTCFISIWPSQPLLGGWLGTLRNRVSVA